MPKLEPEWNSHHSTHPSSPTRAAESRHWSRAHKVSTCMYVCLCSTAPRWSSTTFLNRERLQAAWLPRGSLSWSCTSLLSLLSSDRKVAARSLDEETRPNRGAIDGCRLRVRSEAYSAYSYKRGMCVGFWRDSVANVCLASVNWCIVHVNQLPSCRRPNMAWSGSEFQESMTLVLRLHHAIYCYKRTYAQPN